jgi:hypothetical protein
MDREKALAEFMNSRLEDVPQQISSEGDSINQLVKEILETNYKGNKYIDGALVGIEGSTRAILNGLRNDGIVSNFRNIKVFVTQNNPRTPIVSYEIQLPSKINYILISSEVSLN